jgi:glycosyltransferase involved in cell wall biosynthesis
MRILHVTDAYLPRQGGIEMHVRDLARAQSQAGDDVDILTLTRHDRPVDLVEQMSVIRPHAGAGISDKVRFMFAHRADGVARGYDVVHAHCSTVSPMSFLAFATPGSARLMTVHSLWRRYTPLYRGFDHLLHWSEWPVTWSAVSHAAAHDVRRAARRPIDVAVLPNGIDLDDWEATPRVGPPEQLRILAVMRLAARKRPMPLLQILRDLRRAVSERITISAVICGDGPSRPAMTRYLARHGMTSWVTLTGHVSRAEVRRQMAAADVFVAPAQLESFGIAALEAHAAGLPVVGRRGTGLSDFIADGEGGMLVDGDRQMTKVLAAMATNDEHKTLSTSAELETFRWPVVLQRHRDLYVAAGARMETPKVDRSA